MITVPFLKPKLPHITEIEHEVAAMLVSGILTNFGPWSEQLEQMIASYLGVRYCLAVANGTTGLFILLSTLPKGSEVVVPSFTFPATIQALIWNGLHPRFVDVDRESLNVSTEAVQEAISDRTSAVVAVNCFGAPCEIASLEEIASKCGISLFFDSAHAFGACYRGTRLGAYGSAEVFSLSATKTLPCGEGGLITTNDNELCKELLARRNYGIAPGTLNMSRKGTNGKISEFAALLGVKGLTRIEAEVETRNRIAATYRKGLQGFPGLHFQAVAHGSRSCYKDFAILIDKNEFGKTRDQLVEQLASDGIETRLYFSQPVHRAPVFSSLECRLKNTDEISSSVLCLPIYSSLNDDEIGCICRSVSEAYGTGPRGNA